MIRPSVRRLYNVSGRFDGRGGFLQGPEELWIEQFAELTLGEGMSTYILGSDDPDDIRRFAEVAAGVREAVGGGSRLLASAPCWFRSRRRCSLLGAWWAGGRWLQRGADAAARRTTERRTAVGRVRAAHRPRARPGPHVHAARLASGQHLIQVHDHLRAELEQIRDLVEQVAAGSIGVGQARSHINTMTMRQNNWTLGVYCESYCRLVTTHHSIEDASLFPRLRRADPALAPVVNRLQEEHQVIHDVLEGVDKALVALVDGSGDIDGLRAAVDLLDDTLLSHLSYEERELVEPLARLGVILKPRPGGRPGCRGGGGWGPRRAGGRPRWPARRSGGPAAA